MRRSEDYDWLNLSVSGSKNFTCGYCSAAISSNEHFDGWKQLERNVRPPWSIYICHSCGRPNFFDTDGTQSPILYDVRQAFPAHIISVSPEFVTTYNQALSAEKLKFDKIAGPGFRRALEFLIKDFLISQIPEDAADIATQTQIIKDKQLGPCITDHISNDKIKATARGATYIGNDETHYTKKWPDKDIQDLKRFISLTVHWIEAEIATAEMQKEMGL